MSAPRIAIAHDYLTQRGGAERVVLALTRAFPEAPVYTTLYEPAGTYPEFEEVDVRPSMLNRVGPLRRRHRLTLPLLPVVSSSIFIDADVVIASSSGWAHGFRTNGRKLVYCYSPARWLYESERYLGDDVSTAMRRTLAGLTPALKLWDRHAASTVDTYLAISSVTQERIERTYGIKADIVPAPHSAEPGDHAPVEVPGLPEPGYFLVVSRLLPYKNVREIVRAFADRPGLRLVVVGVGPEKESLVAEATANVTFLESLTDDELAATYTHCRALVAASHEDFGLTPLEAAAYGKPSVVLRWGGFLDTVVEGETGVFFDAPEPEVIGKAIEQAAEHTWSEACLRQRAERFSEQAFAERMRSEALRLAR